MWDSILKFFIPISVGRLLYLFNIFIFRSNNKIIIQLSIIHLFSSSFHLEIVGRELSPNKLTTYLLLIIKDLSSNSDCFLTKCLYLLLYGDTCTDKKDNDKSKMVFFWDQLCMHSLVRIV